MPSALPHRPRRTPHQWALPDGGPCPRLHSGSSSRISSSDRSPFFFLRHTLTLPVFTVWLVFLRPFRVCGFFLLVRFLCWLVLWSAGLSRVCELSGILKLYIAAVQVIIVPAFLRRDQVHVFQAVDVIGREEPVADAGGVAVHAALVIAPQKPVHVEFGEILVLLLL